MTFTSITDGLSNTLMFGEKYCRCNGQGAVWGITWVGDGWTPVFAGYNKNKWQQNPMPPKSSSCDPTTISSSHTGGMNACLADGSVKFLSSGLDPTTWWSLCTPQGNEAITTNW